MPGQSQRSRSQISQSQQRRYHSQRRCLVRFSPHLLRMTQRTETQRSQGHRTTPQGRFRLPSYRRWGRDRSSIPDTPTRIPRSVKEIFRDRLPRVQVLLVRRGINHRQCPSRHRTSASIRMPTRTQPFVALGSPSLRKATQPISHHAGTTQAASRCRTGKHRHRTRERQPLPQRVEGIVQRRSDRQRTHHRRSRHLPGFRVDRPCRSHDLLRSRKFRHGVRKVCRRCLHVRRWVGRITHSVETSKPRWLR